MPTYEFQCLECEHRFEIWQSVDEAPPKCPNCGANVRKVFHPPRVIFKGSGFYVTDSRAEKAAQEKTTSGGAKGSDTKGSDAGTSEKSESAGGGENGAQSATKTQSSSPSTASGDGERK